MEPRTQHPMGKAMRKTHGQLRKTDLEASLHVEEYYHGNTC